MTELSHVRDLFALPEQVHEGDFVLKLTEGLQHADETARTYVATEALVDAFNQSLTLVDSALRDGRSKATYLHGSFGSGKSHFMAMLSLLLSGHEAAWRNPAFHALRQKFDFVGKKKLCQLSFHMIGAQIALLISSSLEVSSAKASLMSALTSMGPLFLRSIPSWGSIA